MQQLIGSSRPPTLCQSVVKAHQSLTAERADGFLLQIRTLKNSSRVKINTLIALVFFSFCSSINMLCDILLIRTERLCVVACRASAGGCMLIREEEEEEEELNHVWFKENT